MNNNFRAQSKRTGGKVENIFNKSMLAVGGAIAAAFSVQAIVSFGQEAVKLAAKAEGVEAAFERLNKPTLLDNLREATRGTVSDVELMRQAVRAENFKVPLDQLATFFEFATKRAAQTGESVDYLVNSIIDGIGRKSTLVMDNLGISAATLQEEIKKTGDFGKAAGNIIAEELGKAGDVATTSAQKIDRITAAYSNLQTELGKKILGGDGDFLTQLSELMDGLARSLKVGELLTKSEIKTYDQSFAETTDRIRRDADKLIDKYGSVEKAQEAMINASMKYRVEANIARENDTIRANRLLGIAEAYEEASKNLGSYTSIEKEATQSTKEYNDAILAQADAIIKARAEAEKMEKVYSQRMQGPKMGRDLDLGVDPSQLLGGVSNDMQENTNLSLERQNELLAQGTMLANMLDSNISNAFVSVIEGSETFGEAMTKALKNIMIDIIAMTARMLIFKAVLSSLGLGGLANPAQGFLGLIGGGPSLGGGASGLGSVGSMGFSGLGKMQTVNVVGRISGRDILLSQERSQYDRTRERGF